MSYRSDGSLLVFWAVVAAALIFAAGFIAGRLI